MDDESSDDAAAAAAATAYLTLDHGGVAQLGEHLPCKQPVASSILVASTMSEVKLLPTCAFVRVGEANPSGH